MTSTPDPGLPGTPLKSRFTQVNRALTKALNVLEGIEINDAWVEILTAGTGNVHEKLTLIEESLER